ncbi:helix-turn-helix transcriptional regulator [Streptomyces sp. NPDC101062]|uniref:helix-turn-helix transcriptional regulator n=1 Tax=unclassified Streptomyces TaxID=2593676 RepID=UPI003823524D
MPARTFDRRAFRAVRRAADLSQRQVAEGMGVQEAAVAKWEGEGTHAPAPEKLPRLAMVMGRPLDELFPREGLPDLADLRADAGYSQKDTLAITSTRSTGAVSSAEKGKRRLPPEHVSALATAFGVSTTALLAAQERSFGNDAPVPKEPAARADPAPPSGRPAPRSVAEKIGFLLEQMPADSRKPSDAEIAGLGNRRSGSLVLTAELVSRLRSGAETSPSPDELGALARALDAPPLFFEVDDEQLDRIVGGLRLARSGFTKMAARGDTELPLELMDYVAGIFREFGHDAEQ